MTDATTATYPRYTCHLLPLDAVPAGVPVTDAASASTLPPFEPASVAVEGFIHASSPSETLPTANRWLRDVPADALRVLIIDTHHDSLGGVYYAQELSGPRELIRAGTADAPAIVWEPGVPPAKNASVARAQAKGAKTPAAVLFPHIYGALPVAAIAAVLEVEHDGDAMAPWSRVVGLDAYAAVRDE
ncbi:hypothetical protein AMAG_14013 [Allomyces macrogynus ATCC 38327]|uniref:DUF952 domain-containing protein n=1 Tax=Allomyces macrogynus (strain ATCC 38327) TaxID=578462 RepID=A0A0L0T3M5_ALLM3|nr:hypothetical protein AMAG_14013 [Allomyces macrogynus ATCC 38327]|eukprot:KNE69159.1 hypothetical protein AMAG_14013 [Allomyces macrogynus ATCC 38327]